jgi:hypothetical protein
MRGSSISHYWHPESLLGPVEAPDGLRFNIAAAHQSLKKFRLYNQPMEGREKELSV